MRIATSREVSATRLTLPTIPTATFRSTARPVDVDPIGTHCTVTRRQTHGFSQTNTRDPKISVCLCHVQDTRPKKDESFVWSHHVSMKMSAMCFFDHFKSVTNCHTPKTKHNLSQLALWTQRRRQRKDRETQEEEWPRKRHDTPQLGQPVSPAFCLGAGNFLTVSSSLAKCVARFEVRRVQMATVAVHLNFETPLVAALAHDRHNA